MGGATAPAYVGAGAGAGVVITGGLATASPPAGVDDELGAADDGDGGAGTDAVGRTGRGVTTGFTPPRPRFEPRSRCARGQSPRRPGGSPRRCTGPYRNAPTGP